MWPIEWHQCQWPWVTLKVTFSHWNLSTIHISNCSTQSQKQTHIKTNTKTATNNNKIDDDDDDNRQIHLTEETEKAGQSSTCIPPGIRIVRLCVFLTYIQTGYATATYRMTFNQHSAYTSLPAVTTHANEPEYVMGYWTKVDHICSRGNLFVDGVNATIRCQMRGRHLKTESNVTKT